MKSNRIFYLGAFAVGLGVIYLVAGAKIADIDASQKRDLANIQPFDYQYSYSQTFLSTAAKLYLIEFPVASLGYPEQYTFVLSLQLEDEQGKEIARQQYRVASSSQVDTIRFSFPPQADSANKQYRLRLETDAPPGVLSLFGSDYDSYSAGALDSITATGIAKDQDLAFFTYGKPDLLKLFQGTMQSSGRRLLNFALLTIAFWSVGYLVTLVIRSDQDPVERGIHSLLIGIALPPVFFFFLAMLRIRFMHASVSIILSLWIVGAALLLFFRNRNWKVKIREFGRAEILVLVLLFLLAATTRLMQINDLLVPNGVGSQFHAHAIERIHQQGGMPLDSIYHLGFHMNTALVIESTGESIPESMLLYGQWLSVVSGLALYLLAREFLGDWKFALVVLCFYWFISPIPAYLMNIGRYPFLQGLTLLPWAVMLLWNNYKYQKRNEVLILIAVTGLFLSHYGALAILLVLVTAYALLQATRGGLSISRTARTTGLLAVSALVVVLVVTKLIYILSQGSWDTFLIDRAEIFTSDDYTYVFQHTLRYGGVLLWTFGLLGAALYCARDPRKLLLLSLCLVGLLGVDGLQMFLLGHSATRPANTLFALVIPLSLSAGLSIQYFFSGREFATTVSIVALALAGAYNITGIVNPANVFFSDADREAMDWIASNTPEESVILINSYPWDGDFSLADGGSWIPYITGRQTVFANTREEYDNIQNFIQHSEADYIYIGSGYGNLTPLLMNKLQQDPVYDTDGIYIYKLEDREH